MMKNIINMAFLLSFTFRNKAYKCEYFIDNSAFPCFLFVLLKDEDLIEEFGEDITIKTDGDNRLAKKDDYPELAALRQTLFDAIKTTLKFVSIKTELRLLEEPQKNHIKIISDKNREIRSTRLNTNSNR